jgi:hypothetical protein
MLKPLLSVLAVLLAVLLIDRILAAAYSRLRRN